MAAMFAHPSRVMARCEVHGHRLLLSERTAECMARISRGGLVVVACDRVPVLFHVWNPQLAAYGTTEF